MSKNKGLAFNSKEVRWKRTFYVTIACLALLFTLNQLSHLKRNALNNIGGQKSPLTPEDGESNTGETTYKK